MRADEVAVAGALPLWEVPGWRDRFGVVAGITGGGGGFDLGLRGSAPVGEVLARWEDFGRHMPGFTELVNSRQVHGVGLLTHRGEPVPGIRLAPQADGHVTAVPGRLLTVSVADCIPVYILAPGAGVVALLHAGWRGAAGGILERAIGALQTDWRVEPGELVIHLGVGISGQAYEVGSEVVDGLGLERTGEGPWHVDIRAALADRARAAGVVALSVSGHCTSGSSADFHSHRASGGGGGRMVAFLGFPGEKTGPSP